VDEPAPTRDGHHYMVVRYWILFEYPPTPNFDSLAPRSSSSSSSSSSVYSFVVRRQQRQRQQQQKADGKYCITGGNDRTVRLWNPTRADPACGRRGLDRVHRNPSSPSSSPSSSRVLSSQEYHGGQRPTRPGPPDPRGNDDIVDPSSWRDTLPSALPMQTYADGHVHPVRCASTNRSSTVLLSASDRTLLATDLVTARAMRKWWGHEARIEYVACLGGDGDGNVDDAGGGGGGGGGGGVGEGIYASASYDSTVRLWDARSRSQEPLMILDEAGDAVTCVSAARGMGEARIVTSSVDGKVCASCRLFGVDNIRIPPPRLIVAHYYLDAILPSRFFSRFRVPSLFRCYYDVLFSRRASNLGSFRPDELRPPPRKR
jgi:WD40 repeat protein